MLTCGICDENQWQCSVHPRPGNEAEVLSSWRASLSMYEEESANLNLASDVGKALPLQFGAGFPMLDKMGLGVGPCV